MEYQDEGAVSRLQIALNDAYNEGFSNGIDSAWDEARDKGFDEGYDEAKENASTLIDEAYEEGFDTAMTNFEADARVEDLQQDAYDNGYAAAKKMFTGKLNAIAICLSVRRDTEAFEIIEGLLKDDA